MTLADDLRVGVPGPAGSRIRWRRNSDSSSTLSELFARAAGAPLPDDHYFLEPTAGSATRIGAARGQDGIVRHFAGKSLEDLILGYFTTLVAEVDGRVVGACFTAPPPPVLDRPNSDEVARAVMRVVKLAGLSVRAEYTNRGIATSLLTVVRSVYAHCGAVIMYGEFDRDQQAELAPFYRGRGFDLLGPRDVIDFSPVLGTEFYMKGTAHEQLFASRLVEDYPFRVVVPRVPAAFSRDGSAPRRSPTPPPATPQPATPPPAAAQPAPTPEPSPARRRRWIRWWKRS